MAKKKKNTGIPFEILVRSIFQEILEVEGVKTINVEHDKKVEGKSKLLHQIDVFWEFETAGAKYTAIIQAKDWSTSSVKKEQVLAFKAILDDIPGQPRGYMVTSRRFQSGGKTYAKFEGIKLFELHQKPKPSSIEMQAGTFADFNTNLENQTFEITPYHFSYALAFDLSEPEMAKTKSKINKLKLTIWEISILDENGKKIDSLGKLISNETNKFHAEARNALRNLPQFEKTSKISFEKGTLCDVGTFAFPIQGVLVKTTITKGDVISRPFMRPGISEYILKDVLDGGEKEFQVVDKKILNAI